MIKLFELKTYLLGLNGFLWTDNLPYSIDDTIIEKSKTKECIFDKFNELSFDIFLCWSKQQDNRYS